MSQAMAKLAPMPAATPFRPQITGLGIDLIRCSIGAYCSRSTRPTSSDDRMPPSAEPISRTSAPAEKPRPEPISTTQRTDSSRSTSFKAASSCWRARTPIGFSFSGRLSLIQATPASLSRVTWRSSGCSATSPPLELGAPLLEEGVHAFLLVLGREQEVEVLAFGEEPLLERKLKGEIDRFLGQAERHRGLGRQLPGHPLSGLGRPLGRHDLVDDAELVRALGRDRLPAEVHLHRHVFAGGARPALGAAGARDDAQIDLGLAEARAVAGDHEVTHQRHLAAASQGVAVDRRDQRLGEGGDARPAAGLVTAQLLDRAALGHVADVGARSEDLRAACQDHGPHRVVALQLAERRRHLRDDRGAQGIEDGGPVERDHPDRRLHLQEDELVGHAAMIGHVKKALRDSYGRLADDLRISVTDRCNFRCIYCMPAEGLKWLARDDILRFEEIHRLARIFVERYGVRTIRITGGEPLVRVKVEELVGMINSLDPTLDITMTTNGVLLAQKAQALRDAGLKRVNVSLDTLSLDRFKEMARRDAFERVIEGLAAAEEVGLSPIKLNVVVMKGYNDGEVVEFARLAREKAYDVRFIEFMPLDADGIWKEDLVVPSQRIQEQIEDLFPLVAISEDRPAPATKFKFADGSPGGVGFISSVSQAFCATCNRVRLTAEGGLRSWHARAGGRRRRRGNRDRACGGRPRDHHDGQPLLAAHHRRLRRRPGERARARPLPRLDPLHLPGPRRAQDRLRPNARRHRSRRAGLRRLRDPAALRRLHLRRHARGAAGRELAPP